MDKQTTAPIATRQLALPGALLNDRAPRPFLKWAGGKQQLLDQFEPFFPRKIGRYFEPFVGGGAVFFHLYAHRQPSEIFLFDNNDEVVNAYTIVRDNVEQLITLLEEHRRNHSRVHYYATRNLDRQPVKLTDVERAARTIYLNKTCYNGLYRVNSKGEFNVPMGSYQDPQILYPETLRAASVALQSAVIRNLDFRRVAELARKGDFFYFDPPYDPISKTSSFTSYTAGNFRYQDQADLARVFDTLTSMGCLCMLSNSYTQSIVELYQGYRIKTVVANRAINSDGAGRNAISEAVILNYDPD